MLSGYMPGHVGTWGCCGGGGGAIPPPAVDDDQDGTYMGKDGTQTDWNGT